MAGIKEVLLTTLSQLSLIRTDDSEGNTDIVPYIRVWNNQLNYIKDGEMYLWPRPAIFLEIQNQSRYQTIGEAYRNSDLVFRMHLIGDWMNDQEGATFEQDLNIFDLRDKLLINLTYFRPAGCGAMTCVNEEADYSHDNLYHLVMDFVANFTDSRASRLDPGRDYYIDGPVPVDLEIKVDVFTNIPTRGGLITEFGAPITDEDGNQIITEN